MTLPLTLRLDRRLRQVWFVLALALAIVPSAVAGPQESGEATALAEPPDEPAVASSGPDERLAEAGRVRLARHLARTALDLLRLPEPTESDFSTALVLSEWATELAPEWLGGWRVNLQIATAAEAIDERGPDRLQRALSAIVRLDPRDEVARLRLLSLAVDRYPTAEGRAAAYTKLLAEENVSKLGPAVASRLAFELALLLYRSGDVEGFAKWLAEAVALDPAHPAATEMAAGFLRHSAGDSVGEAELHLAAAVANPSNLTPARTLAEICLANGAFLASSRLYGLLVPLAPPNEPSTEQTVGALALSQWALGQGPAAIDLITRRRDDRDRAYREEARLQDPEFDPLNAAQYRAVPERTLATLRAVIEKSLGTPDAAAALDEAVTALRVEAERLAGEEMTPESSQRLAAIAIESLSLVLWLAEDVQSAVAMFERLQSAGALTPEALDRINGWLAYRAGEFDRAIELLEPLQEDSIAAIGLAGAQLALGRRSDAARTWLSVARKVPGSALGVWSRDRLAELLGQPLPPSDAAQAIEALIAGLPRTYDRLLLERERAIGLAVRPRNPSVGPLQPLILDIEISNLTDLPLEIGSAGPIEPNIAILASATVAQLDKPVMANAIVVPISNTLRLAPRARVTVPVDLGLTEFGQVLDRTALSGSTISGRAITNFRPVSGGALQPGVLGAKAEAPQIRVEGCRVSGGWVEDAIGSISTPDCDADLVTINLLAAVGMATENSSEQAPEGFDSLSKVWPTLFEVWPKLDPASQGWLMASFPGLPSPGMEKLDALARESDEPLTIIGYLLGRVRNEQDPLLAKALVSEDPRLRQVAELVRDRAVAVAADRAARQRPGRQ